MSQSFAVRMDVHLPPDMDADARADLLAREKEYAQGWMRTGAWKSIWRCAGEYANLSIFEVEGNAQLHEILTGLPLFGYMTMQVTPLCRHPSDIRE